MSILIAHPHLAAIGRETVRSIGAHSRPGQGDLGRVLHTGVGVDGDDVTFASARIAELRHPDLPGHEQHVGVALATHHGAVGRSSGEVDFLHVAHWTTGQAGQVDVRELAVARDLDSLRNRILGPLVEQYSAEYYVVAHDSQHGVGDSGACTVGNAASVDANPVVGTCNIAREAGLCRHRVG